MTTRERLRDDARWAPSKPELRIIGKGEVCERTNQSYPTIWSKMRAGTFPRSVVIGGRVGWYEHEIDQWLRDLPRQKLKGET